MWGYQVVEIVKLSFVNCCSRILVLSSRVGVTFQFKVLGRHYTSRRIMGLMVGQNSLKWKAITFPSITTVYILPVLILADFVYRRMILYRIMSCNYIDS